MKHRIVLLGLLTLCGCQSAGVRVTDLGSGRHHLAIRSQYGEATDRANAAKDADDYCKKSGQRAVIESFDDQGAFVVSPSTGVTFTCGSGN